MGGRRELRSFGWVGRSQERSFLVAWWAWDEIVVARWERLVAPGKALDALGSMKSV